MLFQTEHIPLLMFNEKTRTRRLQKAGEVLIKDYPCRVLTPGGRIKWMVGRDYAVCAGRGEPGVLWKPQTGVWIIPFGVHNDQWQSLRIEITALADDVLGPIGHTDALAEGITFDGNCYRSFADQPGDCISDPTTAFRRVWEYVNGPRSWCPHLPIWVITFKVVRP